MSELQLYYEMCAKSSELQNIRPSGGDSIPGTDKYTDVNYYIKGDRYVPEFDMDNGLEEYMVCIADGTKNINTERYGNDTFMPTSNQIKEYLINNYCDVSNSEFTDDIESAKILMKLLTHKEWMDNNWL